MRRLCTQLFLLLAISLAATVAGSATASAEVPSPFASPVFAGRVGVGTHLRWHTEAQALTDLSRARASGISWIREDFTWDRLEPKKGVFDWRTTDGLMAAAARAGVKVLGIIDYSAQWASSDPSGRGDVMYPPRHAADFAAFARAVVEHYGAGGAFWRTRPDLVPNPLAAVELWNEPFGHWFAKPDPSPAVYARLVRAAAPAIRSAAPATKILISGDLYQVRRSGTPLVPWLGALLDADPGLPRLVDAYSVHPYPGLRNMSPDDNHAPNYGYRRVEAIHRLAQHRHASLPIWITEIGWSTAPGVSDAVSEQRQAEYVTAAVRRAAVAWRGFVQRVFVFDLNRSSNVSGDRDGNYGLLRADGSGKPVWSALRHLLQSRATLSALRRGHHRARRHRHSAGCSVRARRVARHGHSRRWIARHTRLERARAKRCRAHRAHRT